jgi:outer membrane cobalamin receptor
MRTAILLALLITNIHGIVRDESGAPLPGVTIYEKGSSETVVTDANGRFALDVAQLPATIVAFLGGFDSVSVDAKSGEIAIVLKLAAMNDSVTVTAKAPRSASTSTYDVRPLDALRTPGAQADLFKALQTLPGVAKIDDGAGLFVRGGDVSEVRVLLDGATIEHPFRYESPTGGMFGSVPPMLLEGISFTTGGFSARYGNALSGILDLRGRGRPSMTNYSATGGLAGLSGSVGAPTSEATGIRASGNFSSTKLLFAVNGQPRQFDRLPHGWDLNASAHYESPRAGSLKVFAMTQRDGVGVDFQKEGFDGFLHSSSSQSIAVASWKKSSGDWLLSGALGADSYRKGVDVGVLDLSTTDRRVTSRFDAARTFGNLVVRAGGDADDASTRIAGTKSIRGNDFKGVGGSIAFDVAHGDSHGGAYTEVEETFGRITPTLGVRLDADRALQSFTADPRVNVTFALTPKQKLRFAWGIFHQTPSPSYFDRVSGTRALDPMEATHWIAGYELGSADGPYFVRAEAYDKTYRKLPLEDAASGFTSDGFGFARGIDLFAAKRWKRLDLRASFSVLDAKRRWTAPDQQDRYALPDGTWSPDFAIPRSLTLISNFIATDSLSGGVSFSTASGKPHTPILGGQQGKYGVLPLYGAINSERLPRYARCDLNLTWHARPVGHSTLLYFVAVNNVFARQNVTDYSYSADYTTRAPVMSLAPRSFYFGLTLFQ